MLKMVVVDVVVVVNNVFGATTQKFVLKKIEGI